MDASSVEVDGAAVQVDHSFVEVDHSSVQVDRRFVEVDHSSVQMDGRVVCPKNLAKQKALKAALGEAAGIVKLAYRGQQEKWVEFGVTAKR